MPDTLTPNYHWTKPEPGASPTTWGAKINTDLDGIDGQVFANANAAAAASAAAATASTAAAAAQTTANTAVTNAAAAQTTANSALALAVPIGSILMWPSTTAPTNYLLCNGGTFSTTTYPALAAVLGTIWGPAGTLPSFSEQSPVGPGSDVDLGDTGSTADVHIGAGGAPFVGVNFIIRAK